MALGDILASATSGLNAAQAGLRAVSNNISNVSVAGYARERVNLSTQVTAGRVTGVNIGEPTRVADRFLEATVYRRSGEMGRSEVTYNYLDRLQALLGEPGATSGLPARLDSLNAAAVAMTGQVSEQTTAVFTTYLDDAIDSMQTLTNDVSVLRADVESELGYTVESVNGLLSRINQLNATMIQMTGQGRSTSGVADQRMQAIEELSGLIGVTVRDQPDGSVAIDTTSGQVLLDRRLRQLSYPITGLGVDQPAYPDIEIRFADASGNGSTATGEKIDSAGVGGKLGGLLDLRDNRLPQFSAQMGTLFSGLAEVINASANEGTSVPPPTSLSGRQTSMLGTERLGFTGAATFAVTDAAGKLVASTRVDFSALGPTATVDDAISAINAGLGGAATASFTNGVLSFAAASSANGVAVAQDPSTPSARAGLGFSHFFGLNNIIGSDTSTLAPMGFIGSDAHGFATGQTVQITMRDGSGRLLGSQALTPTTGGTIGDLVDDLNNGSLGNYGTFSLDTRGRLAFQPLAGLSGATISIPSDSTSRNGSGLNFSSLLQVNGRASGLSDAGVLPLMRADPNRVPLARLDTTAAIGASAVGRGDVRGATALVERLGATVDMGGGVVSTVERYSATLLGKAGLQASQAKGAFDDATVRKADSVNRRDSFSGVNIDEELAQMVILQNSYSAAARVISTASEMFDDLLGMVS